MKGLYYFQNFDFDKFIRDKKLKFVKAEDLRDYDTESIIGTKVTLQIFEDNTEYSNEDITNIGEQIVIKVLDKPTKDYLKFKPFLTNCKISDIQKVNVWGKYNNNLSITGNVEESK